MFPILITDDMVNTSATVLSSYIQKYEFEIEQLRKSYNDMITDVYKQCTKPYTAEIYQYPNGKKEIISKEHFDSYIEAINYSKEHYKAGKTSYLVYDDLSRQTSKVTENYEKSVKQLEDKIRCLKKSIKIILNKDGE